MTMTVTNFRTQHLRPETSPGSGIFSSLATINTTRGIQFQSQGQDVYVPDPNNPEAALPRLHRITGLNASLTGSGTCSAGDLAYFTTWFKSGLTKNMQFWQSTFGYWLIPIKLTGFKVDSDPPKGEDATFEATFESDGTIGDYVDMTGSQTYSSLARSLATAANETLDFNGGGLLDILGAAINFTVITSVQITANPANTTNLTIGAATYPFAGAINGTLAAGQSVRVDGSWTITAGTNDQIKVTNAAGATAKYDIVVVGHA